MKSGKRLLSLLMTAGHMVVSHYPIRRSLIQIRVKRKLHSIQGNPRYPMVQVPIRQETPRDILMMTMETLPL
jgi:hypothetical protein